MAHNGWGKGKAVDRIVQDYYAKEIVDRLCQEKEIVIFGARIVALEVATCLMGEPYHLNIACFLVSQTEGNPSALLGKPVISLEEARNRLSPSVLVLIAAMEKNLDSITESLHGSGFHNFLAMTFESDLWSDLRGNYFMEYCKRNQKRYFRLEKELLDIKVPEQATRVGIYAAKCHVDKRLKEDISRYSWEIPIQVGAELTSKVICDVRDNAGEHISQKNREYCELTALYWIWKNTSSDYAGLCHYRRHFELDGQQILKLGASDIDVIVTVPILNFPSVGAVYGQDHIRKDWEIMVDGIEEICPEYLESARLVQEGIYYYAYNMFVARKRIFDEYCAWLFPLLAYCERHCERKEDSYQNRYIGFLAERLFTIYLKHHESQLKIVHARKHFVETI